MDGAKSYYSICSEPAVALQFAKCLDPQALARLMAVDPWFKDFVANNVNGIVKDLIKMNHAEASAEIYTKDYWFDDANYNAIKWVGGVVYRAQVVKAILTELAREGHRVPAMTERVLLKLWCLMEQDWEENRRQMMSFAFDRDEVQCLVVFIVKLDMLFCSPASATYNRYCELSRVLLAHRSLEVLLQVLQGEALRTPTDLYNMLLATAVPADIDELEHYIIENVHELEGGGGLISDDEYCRLGVEPVDEEEDDIWASDHKSDVHSLVYMIAANSIMRREQEDTAWTPSGEMVWRPTMILDAIIYGYNDPDTGELYEPASRLFAVTTLVPGRRALLARVPAEDITGWAESEWEGEKDDFSRGADAAWEWSADAAAAGDEAAMDEELVEYLEEGSSEEEDAMDEDPAEYLDEEDGEDVYDSEMTGAGTEGGHEDERARAMSI